MKRQSQQDAPQRSPIRLLILLGALALTFTLCYFSPPATQFRLRRMDAASLIRVASSSPPNLEALVELARRAESKGFMDEAARNYLAAAKADRGKARYWNRATEIAIQRGERESAVQSAKAGVLAEPSSSKAHRLYGDILSRDNAWGKAYEEYRKSVELDSKNTLGLEGLAKSAFETHRWSESAEAASKAEELEPANFSPALIRGKAETALGDLALGEDSLRRASRLAPDNAEALTALGELLARLPATKSNQTEVEKSFSKATDLLANKPESREPLYHWGQWLLEKNQPADAAEKFQAALAVKPDDSQSMYALSRALQLSGKPNEASELRKKFERNHALSLLISQLQNRIGREPENAALFARLGDAYIEQGSSELAISAWDRSLQLSPKQPDLTKKRDSAQSNFTSP